MEIVSIARQQGYVVMLCNSDEDPLQEKEIVERLVAQRVDGCIVSPALSREENIALLQRQSIPYVIFECSIPGELGAHNFVGHDNFQSRYLTTRHLLEAGHRKIAFLAWDSPIPNVCERVNGYQSALREYEVSSDYERIFLGELSEKAGQEMAEKLLDSGVTAVIFGHHEIAKGALLYFQNQGIRWPEDFSCVMIGTPEWIGVLLPKITCIERLEHSMASAAARLLLSAIRNSDHPLEQHLFESHIMKGQSVKNINLEVSPP